jgi:RNA polymerase sigma-70 factor (ECF subfamily)
MHIEDSTRVQQLLERLRDGDAAATNELIEHVSDQLCRLVRVIFHKEFPRLEGMHGTGSILSETTLRLLTSLQQVQPQTPRAFFGYVSLEIRRVLLELARSDDLRTRWFESVEPKGQETVLQRREPEDAAGDPVNLAMWTEFHQCVERLPEDEREVVNLRFYQGIKPGAIADLMGINRRTVSRLWQNALLTLGESIPGEVSGEW